MMSTELPEWCLLNLQQQGHIVLQWDINEACFAPFDFFFFFWSKPTRGIDFTFEGRFPIPRDDSHYTNEEGRAKPACKT